MGDKNKVKSAFELSDEDFEKVMSGESDEFSFTEVESDDDTGNTGEPDSSSSDTGDDDPADLDPYAGLFDQDEDDSDSDGTGDPDSNNPADKGTSGQSSDEGETFDLIHKGKLVKVTKEEAIRLAQQGYDYHEKTTRIAPHRKLLDLIDADPELQQVINKYVTSKTTPEVTKREDYETEEEWLRDNLTNAAAANAPIITPAQQTPGDNTGQQEPQIVTALRTRDPQHFHTVGPVLKQVIGRLTMDQYRQITVSPEKVIQFYDKVKEQVLSGKFTASNTQQPSQNHVAPRKKTFNLRSGQGTRSKTPTKKNVWDLGNKEFDAIIRKVKGY